MRKNALTGALARGASSAISVSALEYSADSISIGHKSTSWAVRYSHGVTSRSGVCARSAVPRGTLCPCCRPLTFKSGANCTIAIEGVGGR